MSMQSSGQTRAERSARIAEIKAANEARKARLVDRRANPPSENVPTFRNYIASDGREFDTESALMAYEDSITQKKRRMDSAFNILPAEFRRYGFDDPKFFDELAGLIRQDISDAEIRIKIRGLDAYKTRFGAIQRRINKGLSAISEAEYLALEDQYANTMRRFGLPESYYAKQTNRTNPTFESLIEFDVSPVELEDRLMLGQKRVMEAAPQVRDSIRQFYGDTIKDGDMLAFVVDPKNALEQIRKKVTAAEIGAGASQAGLGTTRQRAEELGTYGVTGETARQGFQTIAGGLERGSQLASIYGEGPYTQEVAETEVFGTAGAPQAGRRRRRITQQEQAAFGGQTGLAGSALSRDRAGQY
jgi:hypothetical protein